jgi:hypothetical protein
MKAILIFVSGMAICAFAGADNWNANSDEVRDGRLEIFAQERKATLAELRTLPDNPQEAELSARVRRLKEDLAGLDREIARVHFPNVAVTSVRTQTDKGVRAPRGATSIAPQKADAGNFSYPAWDVFRNFPSKASE